MRLERRGTNGAGRCVPKTLLRTLMCLTIIWGIGFFCLYSDLVSTSWSLSRKKSTKDPNIVEIVQEPSPQTVIVDKLKKPKYAPKSIQKELYVTEEERETVIIMWDNTGGTPFGWGDGNVKTPNYGGFDIIKDKCSIPCRFTRNRHALRIADAILFDPCYNGPSNWKRLGRHQPYKYDGQQWWWFTYEQKEYFPQMKEDALMNIFDYKMTYHMDADVHITYTCPWGGNFDYQQDVIPFSQKTGLVAFMASNCHTGGAQARTAYVKELMKYIQVDSFGNCLHNRDHPDGHRAWTGSFGDMMRRKINQIRTYKFFLAFENNNITDYVTEKLQTALIAGSVPVYMGSKNVDMWAPDNSSIIKVDQFSGPKKLASYLKSLANDELAYNNYLQWKYKPLQPHFKTLQDNCLFYAECRLCNAVAKSRRAYGESCTQRKNSDEQELAITLNSFGNSIDSSEDFIEIAHHSSLSLTTEFTLMAWIRIRVVQDGRILDKGKAGHIDKGYSLDVLKSANSDNKGHIRLCAANNCWVSSRLMNLEQWYHVAVTYTVGVEGIRLYINGRLDSVFDTVQKCVPSTSPLRVGRPASGGGGGWGPTHGEGIFDGDIDDISIWKTVLSADDIKQAMWRRFCGTEPDMVLYLTFNEGKTNSLIVKDWSTYKNNGYVNGSPSWFASYTKPVPDLILKK